MTPGPGQYAGLVSRGIAFILDAAVAVLVCTIVYEFTVAVLTTFGVTRDSVAGANGAFGFVLAIPVVFCVYCAGSWALTGRTLGMALLGLRIVRVDGDSPGARRSVVRVLGYCVSAILMLGFAWIAVDQRRQGFHDKLAGTFVLYDWHGRE